ncbi:unnamed protein product, partial [Brassica rapa subsp. narinosa]
MNRCGLHSIVLINDPINSFSALLPQFLIQCISPFFKSGSIYASLRVSSSESACISVSGTYWPPNFPNRPDESGRCHRVGSDREVIRTGGSLAMVQETENDDLERDVKLRTLEGDDLKWVSWEERKMMMKEMEKRRFRNGG